MLRHWLSLVALILLVAPTLRADETASPCPCNEPAEAAPSKHRFWQVRYWPKDDGWERRKEACRFIFGPAGPYLYPNRFQPVPTLDGYPVVKP